MKDVQPSMRRMVTESAASKITELIQACARIGKIAGLEASLSVDLGTGLAGAFAMLLRI